MSFDCIEVNVGGSSQSIIEDLTCLIPKLRTSRDLSEMLHIDSLYQGFPLVAFYGYNRYIYSSASGVL